ncbi:fluoride efflux transporter FluC [Lysobacter korlensis]|uniref:Fluoride-specific ion channel FluC n=1 Tax=Lysobacter korlensis TaxID=553636 RepID=A0ABV6RUJ7_9GAMM
MSAPVPDPVEGTSGAEREPAPEPVEGTGQAAHREPPLALVLLAVFAAGALGTAARLAIDLAAPAPGAGIPWSTLVVNTVGSFALGLVVAMLSQRAPEWLRAGVTTGLLGSFTTFSAITVATVALTGSGALLSAAVLLLVSVVAGVLAALAGMALGSAMRRSAPRRPARRRRA